jgi:MYXO-CTERM domain-containing protein
MPNRLQTTLLALLAPTAAAAHPGDHALMSWSQFASHLAEPDHLALLGLAVLVAVAVVRYARRRAEARDPVRGRKIEKEKS